MEEDAQDSQRTEPAHKEEIDGEKAATKGSIVGELIFHQLAGHIPANEQTGEETSYGQENLSRNEVEDIEETLFAYGEETPGTQRQRADSPDKGTRQRDSGGSTRTGELAFLLKERRTHLMKGDERRERRHGEQGIESQGDDPANDGHAAEGFLKHIGKGDENERWSAVGVHTHGKSCGENHES